MVDLDNLPGSILDATAAAIGESYDCTRVWSAWGYGTMSQDDFARIDQDNDRVAEIAKSAVEAFINETGFDSIVAERDALKSELAIANSTGIELLKQKNDSAKHISILRKRIDVAEAELEAARKQRPCGYMVEESGVTVVYNAACVGNFSRHTPVYKRPAPAQPSRELLRAIVDATWGHAYESEQVPSTAAADKIIDAVLSKFPVPGQNDLAVWYGPMPESNGKTNWTAILYRKNPGGFLGGIGDGYTIDQSEYPDRVRYEADRVRYLIGELKEPPFILDYDSDKHSGYKEQTPVPAQQQDNSLEQEIARLVAMNDKLIANEQRLIEQLWQNSNHGASREDIEAAFRAGATNAQQAAEITPEFIAMLREGMITPDKIAGQAEKADTVLNGDIFTHDRIRKKFYCNGVSRDEQGQIESVTLVDCPEKLSHWRKDPVGALEAINKLLELSNPNAEDPLKLLAELRGAETPQTPQQIIARANALACEFYRIRGYVVPAGYKFHEATHPHEREAWQLTVAAFEALECADLEDVLTELEEE